MTNNYTKVYEIVNKIDWIEYAQKALYNCIIGFWIYEYGFMITVTLFCRKMSYVAIYALSGKKIIGQKFACVKFLTNIMSDCTVNIFHWYFLHI